jgi:hypothetical protein
MVREVALVCVFFLVAVGPDTEGFLLVHVGLPDTHGDGENGYVHHDEVADLDRRVEIGDADDGETSSACRGGLEKTGEEAMAGGKVCNGIVFELYNFVSHNSWLAEWK